MKKILTVFGTRPEAIKMVPVIKSLRTCFNLKICITAQHREMLDQVMNIFNIKADYDLNIMKNDQTLIQLTSRILEDLSKVIIKEKPDLILVHGDTTTSMAASLAAFYLGIPVGHVEAGLRTNDIHFPFPEELNRQFIARLADYHFAPTEKTKENLLLEGIDEEKIFITGNTVIDSLMNSLVLARNSSIDREIEELLPFIKEKDKDQKKIILVTGHRRENFGEGMKNIFEALLDIAKRKPEVKIVYPVHLNPKVLEPANRMLRGNPNIFLINPLGYLQFIRLMDLSCIILTDSGGIQEEAPSLGKPVLVLRNNTERPEAVEAGTVKVVGTSTLNIVDSTLSLLENKQEYSKMSKSHNPYGDGKASQRIKKILLKQLN